VDDQERTEELHAGAAIGGLARHLAIAGGALLVGIAALVTTSVTMRWVTGSGITGDFEIVQLLAALGAFAMFPLCIALRGNIVVDTFTSALPTRFQQALDRLWDVSFGVIVLVMAWRLAVGAVEQLTTKTSLMMLPLPTWWVVASCSALFAVTGLVSLVVGLRSRGDRP
jgi:TRAP-type C4-dicarboxylate transport system permease small subunit